ncbi:MAG: hypothetical protein U0P46_14440 [Holophagaceae bacterium]
MLVALGGLGTLGHTLLSAEALMLRGWRIEAVLLSPKGRRHTPRWPRRTLTLLREFLPVRSASWS